MQRKLKLAILFWFIQWTLIQAQVEKGTWLVSGVIRNSISLPGYGSSSSWLIFDLYYHTSDRLAVGASNITTLGGQNTFGLRPGVRYYLRRPVQTVNFYLQGDVGFLAMNQNVQWESKVGLGLHSFIDRELGLDLGLSYYHGFENDAYAHSSLRWEGGVKVLLNRGTDGDEIGVLRSGAWLFSAINASVNPGEVFGLGYSVKDDYLGLQLNPTFGYLISKNWLLGSAFSLIGGNYNDFSINAWSASPFVRYYLNKQPSRWQFFPEVGLAYHRSILLSDVAGLDDQKITTIDGSFALGTNYFVGSNVALEGKLVLLPDGIVQLNFGLQTFLSGK